MCLLIGLKMMSLWLALIILFLIRGAQWAEIRVQFVGNGRLASNRLIGTCSGSNEYVNDGTYFGVTINEAERVESIVEGEYVWLEYGLNLARSDINMDILL